MIELRVIRGINKFLVFVVMVLRILLDFLDWTETELRDVHVIKLFLCFTSSLTFFIELDRIGFGEKGGEEVSLVMSEIDGKFFVHGFGGFD